MNQKQKQNYYKKCRALNDEELKEEITFQIKQAKPGYVVRCLIVQAVQREHRFHLTV